LSRTLRYNVAVETEDKIRGEVEYEIKAGITNFWGNI
jgi:hypothetical protein